MNDLARTVAAADLEPPIVIAGVPFARVVPATDLARTQARPSSEGDSA
jgi:hypothetical protein